MQKIRKYKPSIFNYCAEKEDGCLIFNTLYNSLVRLNVNEYLQYLGKKGITAEFENELLHRGLWVEEELDELKKYLACAKAYTLFMPRPISVTITTTLKCNARCTYCYEKGIYQKDMDDDMVEPLLSYLIDKGKKNGVHINWFGGEPLLNPELMNKIVEELRKSNITFGSYMITNASKITEEMLSEKLDYWNINDMQITLDGTEKQYAIRKNYYDKKEGEYYRILSIIKAVAKKEIFINIRINIDKKNQDDILEMLQEIDGVFKNKENVVYYPAFITGGKDKLDDDEKVKIIKKMFRCVSNPKKLTAGTKFYSYPRMHACMNGDPYSFSVDVYGNIYSCEHHVGKEKLAIGNLKNGLDKKDRRGEENNLSDECLKCVFLPKCFGGCESNLKDGDTPCMIEKYLLKAYIDML